MYTWEKITDRNQSGKNLAPSKQAPCTFDPQVKATRGTLLKVDKLFTCICKSNLKCARHATEMGAQTAFRPNVSIPIHENECLNVTMIVPMEKGELLCFRSKTHFAGGHRGVGFPYL